MLRLLYLSKPPQTFANPPDAQEAFLLSGTSPAYLHSCCHLRHLSHHHFQRLPANLHHCHISAGHPLEAAQPLQHKICHTHDSTLTCGVYQNAEHTHDAVSAARTLLYQQ